MKINTLTLCAFGPYKQEQILNFDLLNTKQLFLITGPTGSGKTTIFDAISFALYGKSSGNGRDGDDFVSHHAKDADLTYVELDFNLKGKHCVIRREPKQIRQKVRQEGMTIKNASATLTVDDQIYTSVLEVNQKVEELLGIDASQFRQIVMLPQGEFRQLLEANSSEKEQIFRKIFKTDYYKMFQDQLRSKVRELESILNDQKVQLGQEVHHINPQDDTALLELTEKEDLNYQEIIVQTKQSNKKLADRINETHQSIQLKKMKSDQIMIQINETKSIQLKYKQLEIHKGALIELNKTDIAQLEEQVVKLNQAIYINDIEKQWQKSLKKTEELTTTIKEKKANHKDLLELKTNCLSELSVILPQVNSLDELKLQHQALKKQNEKYQEWKKLAEEVHNTTLLVQNKKEIKIKKDQERQQLIEKFNTIIENKSELNGYLQKQQSIRVDVINQKAQVEKLTETSLLISQCIEKYEQHKLLSKKYSEIETDYQQTLAQYEKHHQDYLKAQAGILAEGLNMDVACPVCGSTIHPNKATIPDSVLTSEALAIEKEQMEHNTKIYNKTYNETYTAYERLNDLLKRLSERLNQKEIVESSSLETHDITHKEKLKVAKDLASKLISEEQDFLKTKKNFEELENQYNQVSERLKLLDSDIKVLESELQACNDVYLVAASAHQQLQVEYHLSEKQEKTLRQDIDQTAQKIQSIELAHQTYNDQLNEINIEIADVAATINSLTEQLKLTMSDEAEEKKEFQLRLKNAQFESDKDYKDTLSQINRINEISDVINQYYQDLNYHQKLVQSLQDELEGTIVIDLNTLQEELSTHQIEIESLSQLEKELYAILQGNQRAVDKITQIYQKFSSKLLEYRNTSYLEKIATGSNSMKLTFERYVLTVYFDEIIRAANLRLKDMTVGRYLLLRDDEYTGGRGQQGLDLLVYDHYTNKKRNVKTLSGGESFIASLALALGLADVVSSFTGGIQLDTIFIDEGFGTLDPEALEHAVTTLNKLRDTGRTVGIISHVQELRERIDAKIEITKTNEGSNAKIRL